MTYENMLLDKLVDDQLCLAQIGLFFIGHERATLYT